MVASILVSAAFTTLVIMLAFPETPAARWLHRWLAEKPVQFVADFSWRKFGWQALLVAVFVILLMMGPEVLAALGVTAFDAAMMDLIVAVSLAALSGNFLGAWRAVKRLSRGLARIVRRSGRARARDTRRTSNQPPRKSDDPEPGWAFGLAA